MATKYPGLANHLRKWGLNVKEVSGWQNRAARGSFVPKGVIVHHTATAGPKNAPSLGIVTHGRTGIPGPLSQFLLARDGTVYLIGGGRANHAGTGSYAGYTSGNTYFWGIEAENDGRGEKWGAAQLNAYYRLCAALMDLNGFGTNRVIAHKEWAPRRKIDPAGISMDAFRRNVAAAKAAGQSGGLTPSGDPILREGDQGQAVLNIQNALIKHGHKITADGDFGPATKAAVCAFQKDKGLDVDGIVGQKTWDALRKAPSTGGTTPAPAPTAPKAGDTIPGTGDRWLGLANPPLTGNDVKGVQNALRVAGNHDLKMDGVYGPRTAELIALFQKNRKITERGVGPLTWAALRKVVHG